MARKPRLGMMMHTYKCSQLRVKLFITQIDDIMLSNTLSTPFLPFSYNAFITFSVGILSWPPNSLDCLNQITAGAPDNENFILEFLESRPMYFVSLVVVFYIIITNSWNV